MLSHSAPVSCFIAVYRVASDGVPYSINEFIRWYGVHYTWYWDRAPKYAKLVSADTGAREYSI